MLGLPRSTLVVARLLEAAYRELCAPQCIYISRAGDGYIFLQFVFDQLEPIFNVAWAYRLLEGLEAGELIVATHDINILLIGEDGVPESQEREAWACKLNPE